MIYEYFVSSKYRINSMQRGISNYGRSRGTSREKIYQELGFESLQQRHWFCLFKIINNQSPSYLFQLVPDFVQNMTF